MKRVVVTGIGLLTSLGDSVNKSWNNLLSCKSGIKKISSFDTTDLKCKIAGYISNDPNVENFFISLIPTYPTPIIRAVCTFNFLTFF